MLSSSRRAARRHLDKRLKPLDAAALRPPARGWLRAVRDSLGMSAVQFARQLGVTSQSVQDVERSEAAGTIRLDTLRRTAAALDCTLVYAIVPNHGLEERVERRARAKAVAALSRVNQTMLLEDQQVTTVDQDELIADYIEEHLRDRDLWSD